MKLEWLTRAKKRTTPTSEVSAWDSRCGRYRVEVHRSTLACERGGTKKRKKRKETWYGLVSIGDGKFEPVDSRNRQYTARSTAEAACEKHAGG
jgi:hypothetical protein